ncbi:hypothetical protein [Microbacterium terricola]|uniref:ABC-2 type transport system permease protein n=1 Tax=Microbacterium terricola TaxID=344163 RepID=A0ABM8DZC7_9MICO|nr:hypothetical protein [Microbacterium terricola]UYK41261.1 hypothetical protein OAU46_06405 [Microbacterium terricola]BDV30959.1 hypothetical protein Microterr_16190 [Microbacterium terricola]
MAAHVLRLRLALLVGALRGDRRHVVRTVVGLLLLIAATAAGCWAVVTLGDSDADVMQAVTVLGGSALTLGFALAPLVAGVEDPLDPRRFAVLGASPTPLAGILALAGFVSVPVLAVAALGITVAVVWGEHGVAGAVGGISILLALATCVLLARVCMALTSLFLRERRSRELSGLFALTILVVVVPVGVFLASLDWRGSVPTQLSAAVDVLALTPVGAAWAIPGAVATAGDVALPVLVAIASLIGLGMLWLLLVRVLLTTTERPRTSRERGGLGWFTVAPGTPGGAIAARSLMYWLRDRRYLVNVVVVPITAALTIVPLLIVGVPVQTVALIPVPFMALFLGWLPHNDLAYDSTAVWMHVSAGVRGFADRIGRLVPILLIGVPVLAIAIPVAMSIHGRWALLPAMVGVCAALFGTALGLSSISSVVAPYAVSPPGESPFQQPQRYGSSGASAQALVMLGSVVLCAPVLWWAWLGLGGDAEAADLAFWAGIGTGAGVLIVGITIGALVFSRSGGRIMEFAESV